MQLLVGGLGFLGRHYRAYCFSRGLEITTIYRSPSDFVQKSVENFVSQEEFSRPSGDRLLREANTVVYLAGRSNPGTFADRPWLEISENVEPALRFFTRCAAVNPLLKVIFISSGGTIYGHVPGQSPISENVEPAPISAYGLGKLMIEQALQFIRRTTGLPFCILRVSNAVGRYHTSTTQGLLPIALRAVLEGRAIKIFGDGSQVRDYIDADDVCSAIALASEKRQFVDKIWNVGSNVGRSIIDIIGLIESITGKTAKIESHPARAFDLSSVVLDTSRIQQELGWKPLRNLEQTVREILSENNRNSSRPRELI